MYKEELKDQMSNLLHSKRKVGEVAEDVTRCRTFKFAVRIRKKKIELELTEDQLTKVDNMLKIYVCPISTSIMTNPVIAEDGQTYEEAWIVEWFKEHNTSPISRTKIGKKLIKNYKAKDSIECLQGQRSTLEERIRELLNNIEFIILPI
jgi:hypothetical protein